jgi:hypothetical protein
MKKSYLLSGMIVLGAVVGLNAMQQRPLGWQELDRCIVNERIDWKCVFSLLTFYRGTNLVNEYRDLQYDEPLLELAVEEYNVPATRKLLQEFNANPNVSSSILYEAKSYMSDPEGLVQLLRQYGAREKF